MEARPTQFKGKLFKSKTEAMFAYILDYSMDEYSRWAYEDARFKTPKGYIPDFVEHFGVEHFLSDFIVIAEVKPATPTQAYLRYLEAQFEWIKSNDVFFFISTYVLYIFNPYKKIFKCCEMIDGKICLENWHTPEWFHPDRFDDALNYRFDLE